MPGFFYGMKARQVLMILSAGFAFCTPGIGIFISSEFDGKFYTSAGAYFNNLLQCRNAYFLHVIFNF